MTDKTKGQRTNNDQQYTT